MYYQQNFSKFHDTCLLLHTYFQERENGSWDEAAWEGYWYNWEAQDYLRHWQLLDPWCSFMSKLFYGRTIWDRVASFWVIHWDEISAECAIPGLLQKESFWKLNPGSMFAASQGWNKIWRFCRFYFVKIHVPLIYLDGYCFFCTSHNYIILPCIFMYKISLS